MSHSRIYQISTNPIDKDDYITACSLDPWIYEPLGDYADDLPESQLQKELEDFDKLFEGIFKRDGRVLTFLGCDQFIEDWREDIKRKANNIDFTKWMSLWELRATLKRTHYDSYAIFTSDDCTSDDFAHFIEGLYQGHKPGDKFYIGGILDYHY